MSINRSLVHVGCLALLSVGLAGPGVSYFEEDLPTTLNPLYARSMVDRRTQELIFDRLFFRSLGENRLVSNLVKEFQTSEDRKAITLYLREGITWHDEELFTADDVCFTINAMLNPKTPSPEAREFRESIAGCDANAKRNEVTVRFKRPHIRPREQLGFAVLPEHVFGGNTAIPPQHGFSSRPVGTGPMKGGLGRKELRLQRVQNAHHKPSIRELSLLEGGDPESQVKTLFNRGVQGMVTVPPSRRPVIASQDDVALKSYDLRSWWFIAVNTNRGPLKDLRVRQALNLTLDREELVTLSIGAQDGDISPAHELISGPFIPSSPYYNRQVPVQATDDLGRAAELMKEAGYKNLAGRWVKGDKPVKLNIGMYSPLGAEAQDLHNQVGNQLAAGGFERTVTLVQRDQWNSRVVTGADVAQWDLLIGKWSFGVSEEIQPLFHSREASRGALNIFGYDNSDVDDLLLKFERARTDTEAKNIYHELHATLAEDLPYLFLWKLDTKSAWANEVRDANIAPYYYFTAFDSWHIASK
ncbi:MAG: ABC transporter substrate-binding protein [Myxococcota bacterium]